MRTQLATACIGVCLAGMFATSAEARLDHGIVASTYDQDSITARAKAKRAVQNYGGKAGKRSARKATGKRQARKYKSKSYASTKSNKVYGTLQSRAVTAMRSEAGEYVDAKVWKAAPKVLKEVAAQCDNEPTAMFWEGVFKTVMDRAVPR